jgi:hypothetical protein
VQFCRKKVIRIKLEGPFEITKPKILSPITEKITLFKVEEPFSVAQNFSVPNSRGGAISIQKCHGTNILDGENPLVAHPRKILWYRLCQKNKP